jgi:large conductance mechanosensitive channel
MTQVLADVLRRTGVVGLAIAVAAALAFYDVIRSFVFAFPMVLIGKADEDLMFTVRGTSFQYHDVLTTLISLVIVVTVLALVWQLRPRGTVRCPDCLSEIPREAKVCRYCTSEVQPSA